jgi:hypothetical protein
MSETLSDDVERSAVRIGCFVDTLASLVPFRETEERREVSRHTVSIPVTIQPLDETLEPQGEPFFAMTSEISAHGLSMLISHGPIEKYLLVTLKIPKGTKISVLLEVEHTQDESVGTMVGGRFVTDEIKG